MQPSIAKTTFSEFKKLLETAADRGRVADHWTIESNNPGFYSYMDSGGDDTDEFIARINSYKTMQHGWYSEIGSDFIYILHPYDDCTGEWDKAIEALRASDQNGSEASAAWSERLENEIPEKMADELDDFICNDGKCSDFLVFACDVVDIIERQWSTLLAEREPARKRSRSA
jgi:hypothetical protein